VPIVHGKRTIDPPREPAQQFLSGVTRMSEPCSRKKKKKISRAYGWIFPSGLHLSKIQEPSGVSVSPLVLIPLPFPMR
jgi:hypothetical protein